MKTFSGKVAAITGAASGIGRRLAVNLAKEGCDLAISDINEEELKVTADILKDYSAQVTSHVVDVSSKDQVHEYADNVVEEHGRVNMIFNNAGAGVRDNLARISYEDLEWSMNVNFWGVVYGTKAFLPYIFKENYAHIINVSSVNGMYTDPYKGAYCASKFAVRGFTETLWQELKPTHVGVSCAHPGGVKTGIVRNSKLVRSPYPDTTPEQVAEEFEKLARTTSDQAARIILRGVKKNKKRILVGKDAKLIDILLRIFPVGFTKLMAGKLPADHIKFE